VVVEVVLREIGEHGHTDARAVQAPLCDADGRGLDGAGGQALVHKLREGALQAHGVGRGHAGVGQCRWPPQPQGAYDGAALAALRARQQVERVSQPRGGAGLAIGARHGEHVQPPGRMVEPLGRNRAGGGLEARQRSDVLTFQRKGLHARLLHQAGRGAAHQGIGHMGAPVRGRTGPGDEAVARADQAAVGLQRAGDAAAQPLHGVAGGVEHLHHKDSSTGLATIWGLTAMSGCTPIMRSVCCTTSLNTGAATAPP